jgi:hypothetical protein
MKRKNDIQLIEEAYASIYTESVSDQATSPNALSPREFLKQIIGRIFTAGDRDPQGKSMLSDPRTGWDDIEDALIRMGNLPPAKSLLVMFAKAFSTYGLGDEISQSYILDNSDESFEYEDVFEIIKDADGTGNILAQHTISDFTEALRRVAAPKEDIEYVADILGSHPYGLERG